MEGRVLSRTFASTLSMTHSGTSFGLSQITSLVSAIIRLGRVLSVVIVDGAFQNGK